MHRTAFQKLVKKKHEIEKETLLEDHRHIQKLHRGAHFAMINWVKSLFQSSSSSTRDFEQPDVFANFYDIINWSNTPIAGSYALKMFSGDVQWDSNDAAALAEILKVNTTLSTLDLHHNRIGPEEAAALAEALQFNHTLPSLNKMCQT